MAGSTARGWRFVGLFALCALGVRGFGCGVDEPVPDPTDGFDVGALLVGYGQGIVFPTLTEFATALDVLAADVDAWGAALQTADGRAERLAAQASWTAAMGVWQRVEVMQVGALGSSISRLGGRDLRDAVYSWPTVNACRVDQETLEGAWDDADFFEVEFVNVQGLDAVEHMLWAEEGVSRCDPGVAIIEGGDWDAAGEDGVQQARAAYAAALLDRVDAITSGLLRTWDPAGDDWGSVLAAAGEAESPYADRAEALNEVFAALFYLETTVKDRKLGQPLGLQDCDDERCPRDLESQFADQGLEHLRANLVGGRAVLTGGDAPGFDDLLAHAGRQDLSDALLAALDDTLAALDALDGTALELIASDPAALQGLYDSLKGFTDILKGEFALTLLLDVPSDAANDND